MYEEALRPFGLRGSQFTILQTLSLAGEVSQGRLGEMLAMDSTTLTRTLAIMSRHGWIERRPAKDRRVICIRLAKAGDELFKRVLPAWEEVQAQVRNKLGEDRWNQVMTAINDVTRLVAETNTQSSE
jgi:DNA-binding MarR family transcriptional regulator